MIVGSVGRVSNILFRPIECIN